MYSGIWHHRQCSKIRFVKPLTRNTIKRYNEYESPIPENVGKSRDSTECSEDQRGHCGYIYRELNKVADSMGWTLLQISILKTNKLAH